MERWTHKFEVKPGRWVVVPSMEERLYGEALLHSLQKLWQPPPYFFHLNPGGHVAALKSHLGHAYFGCLDIEDFFGSINRSRLIRILKPKMGYTKALEVANRSLVKLKKNEESYYCLPFGFVQSAYLASICLHESKLGGVMSARSASHTVRVSVYMDDIIVSSNDMQALQESMDEILAAATRSRFTISQAKMQSPSDSITVFNVILTAGLLKITPGRLREFQIALKEAESLDQINGVLNYVRSINPAQIALLTSWPLSFLTLPAALPN